MRRLIARWLPRTVELSSAAERWVLMLAFSVLGVLVAITAANAIFNIGGAGAYTVIRDTVSSIIYVVVAMIIWFRALRVRAKRGAWIPFAAGISLYGLGNVLWSFWIGHLSHPPIPSICDALWLSFYPLAALGLALLTGIRGQNRPPAGVWLDAVVAGCGLAGIGAAFVLAPTVATASGSSLADATELAYPIGDLLLVGMIVGVIALRGWRGDRGWVAMGIGFLLLAVADYLYALQVAGGASRPSALTNLVFVVSVAVMAFTAWQSPPRRPQAKSTSWSVVLVPAGFMIAALGLLLSNQFHRLNGLAFALATVSMIAAIARMGLAFRDVRGLSEARRLAATDDLTSLPNRRQFMVQVEQAIAQINGGSRTLTVLMLDLDNFKELNDTLGHHAGDSLLRMIGPRLENALRSSHTVARLGGDEFAILLYPSPEPEHVATIAKRMLDTLNAPFEVHGLALRVTGSIGIASYPVDAADADELMRHADVAMYQAKEGRNGFDFYAHERNTNSRERLALAGELASALELGGIEVHYQPKADVGSHQIVGVEALVRWRRSDGRMVPPVEFVAAAEHAGLSRVLTGKVLEIALAQVRAWRDAGYDIHVAVNTTVPDLLDGAFPAEVGAALVRHCLPAEALVLEITETSVLADPDRIGTILERLCDLGIVLSLDDFGTGYSSLAHLKSLPVGEIKIDRGFVSRMCTDATDSAIVYAMIQLARKLGIRVVAEGVEDGRTWEELRGLQCDLIQGYVLSRPVPGPDLTRQLEAERAQRLATNGGLTAPEPAARLIGAGRPDG